MRLKHFLTVLCCLGLLAGLADIAPAAYPDKPIKLVSHTRPGGISDLGLRQIQKALADISPVPLVVEGKVGAGGATSIAYMATVRDPDYNVLSVTNTHITSLLTSNPPFTINDLKPLCYIAAEPMVIAVHADSPWKTMKEFFDAAVATKSALSLGAAQVGSAAYIIGSDYKREVGANYNVVPFESVGEMVTALAGKHIDAVVCEPYTLTGQVKAGNIRILACFNAKRLPSLPDVPTIAEAGYNPTSVAKFRGFMVHKDMSKEAMDFLYDLLSTKLQGNPEYLQSLESQDQLAQVMTPEEFGVFLEKMVADTKAALDVLGLTKKQ